MKFRVPLPSIIEKPDVPNNISQESKWLSGEGAGSWFEFIAQENKNTIQINRYTPEGEIECSEVFELNDKIDLTIPFEVTYPSFCNKVTILQNKIKCTLVKKDNET